MTSPAAINLPARARSLLPKEHGAYGQLALPLTAALAAGSPTVAALALTASFAATFVAHEPVLVLTGARGSRAQREDGARAGRLLAGLLGVAIVGAAIGAVRGGATVAMSLLLPAALAAAMVPFVVTKRERSDVGEVLAATALSSTCVPVALACGASTSAAFTAWAVWAPGFAVSTLVIRGVIAHARARADARLGLRALAAGLLLVGAIALAVTGRVALALPLGLTPLCGASLALAIVRPRLARIKVVGWSVVATSVTTAFVLALTLR